MLPAFNKRDSSSSPAFTPHPPFARAPSTQEPLLTSSDHDDHDDGEFDRNRLDTIISQQSESFSSAAAANNHGTPRFDAFDVKFWEQSLLDSSVRSSKWRSLDSDGSRHHRNLSQLRSTMDTDASDAVSDDASLNGNAPFESDHGCVDLATKRARSQESNTYGSISMHLCPIATEVFRDVYAEVQPPEFLDVLVEASEISDDQKAPVHFAVMAGDEDMNSEKAVRMGAFQCNKVAEFLNKYGFGGIPPRPASEMPNHVLYIGIPCFTEHPDEIIPTIESILRNGGDDSLKVHVVLCADVSIDPVTKQRVDAVPFGATWKRNDGRFTFTFLNKGLKAFTGKTSSLYLINKFVKAHMKASMSTSRGGGDIELATGSKEPLDTVRPAVFAATKNYLLLADTRIIYGNDSITLMVDYMRNHSNVIACTGTQELYPIRWSSTSIEGTPARRLHERRPTYWEWLGAPAMQQFEFEANYAASQFAYNQGGRLAILPGPCHFLDMEKIMGSNVFEQFNHDILKFGSVLTKEHWLKLYVMAEDRHLSTLYATKTGFKTAWVSDAQFFYKPEKTWMDVLQQRLRWQGGTLAQMYVTVFRPSVIELGSSLEWAWWYTALSLLSLVQFGMCCCGNAIWVAITEFGRAYSPLHPSLRDPLTDAVVWGNFVFPWVWVGWASLINVGCVKYADTYSAMMMCLSLVLSAASVIVNFISLVNPKNPNCNDDDDEKECLDYNWMKILAISLACLPIIAWMMTGPSSGFASTRNLIKTSVLSFFTPILFAPHQYNSTPLHVVARLQDLTWRGNKVMQSEVTTHSGWVKWVGWTIVVVETALVGLSDVSPIHKFRYYHIDKVTFVIVLLVPQLIPVSIGAFLALQNAAGALFSWIFSRDLRHRV